MKKYERPVIIVGCDLAEGVYAASGAVVSTPGCDSFYMNGVYQAPDYSQWAAGEQRGYKQQFGCHGCPAFTAEGCGLQSHFVDSGFAGSYDVDNGKRMPKWEAKLLGPDDPVTDWDC